jgi:hypothetical protein
MNALVELRVPDEDEDPLRLEALDLLDQCLTQGDLQPIMAFVEQLLADEPPALEVLRRLNDDLQQRLLVLRTKLYNMRDKLVSTLTSDYVVDVTPFMPAESLDLLHLTKTDQIVAFAQAVNQHLNAAELGTLRDMLTSAVETAAGIQRDVEITQSLQTLILDWLDAFSAVASREYWDEFPSRRGLLH